MKTISHFGDKIEKNEGHALWHETGHVVTGFLHNLKPNFVFAHPSGSGMTSFKNEGGLSDLWDVMLAGHAWTIKYMNLYDDGFFGCQLEDSDWQRMGRPSRPIVDKLTKELLDRTAFTEDITLMVYNAIEEYGAIWTRGVLTELFIECESKHHDDFLKYRKWFDNRGKGELNRLMFKEMEGIRSQMRHLQVIGIDYAEDVIDWSE